jgi:hypothetical protein
MSDIVASLVASLTLADGQLIAACERDTSALEGVAAAAEQAAAAVTGAATEEAAAVTEAADEEVAATEASTSRMAELWAALNAKVGASMATLKTEVSAGFANIGSGIEKEAATGEKAWKKITSIGKISAIGLAAIGAESIHMAADFQTQMELVHTQAGIGQQDIAGLSQQVLALAPTVGIGPDKLAEGLYHVESAGFDSATAMQILAGAAKDSAIGMSDMESTTQALIGTMAVGFSDVKNAADAAAYLNQTVGIGDMRMDKLAAAISTGVLPSFKSAGLGMEDFSASLATLTDNVTPADEAATRLRMTVAMMSSPSQAAALSLNGIGMSSTTLAEDMRKPQGLLTAIMDLKAHLEASYPASKATKMSMQDIQAQLGNYSNALTAAGVDVSQQTDLLNAFKTSMEQNGTAAVKQHEVLEKAFGGGRTSGAILTLIEETTRLQTKYTELGTSASRASNMQDAWAQTQKTFNQQLHQVTAQVQVLGIQVGSFLMPIVSRVVEFFVSHQWAMKAFFAILVAGMVAFTIAVIANTVAMLANPTVWIILAIIAVIALLVVGIYLLVKHWNTVWNWIKQIAGDVWDWLVGAWHRVADGFMATVSRIKHYVIDPVVGFFRDYLLPPIRIYMEILTWIFKFAWGFLSMIIADFVAEWKKRWAMVTDVFHDAYNLLLQVALWITKNIIFPIIDYLHWLHDRWVDTWNNVVKILRWAYSNALKPIFDMWKKDIYDPFMKGLDVLGKAWDTIWHGIQLTVSSVWNTIKPFVNDISGFFDKMGKGLSNPGQLGANVAHMLGFDEGGWVPGSPGTPLLAVVHGGEFVVSRDMLAGRNPSPIQVGRTPGSVGTGGPTQPVIHVHNHVYIDGKEIQQSMMRTAGRNKLRNATTGLTGPPHELAGPA